LSSFQTHLRVALCALFTSGRSELQAMKFFNVLSRSAVGGFWVESDS